ncbi:hypothetical protein Ancab_040005 [Ancistrocladus abbreviatus]
MIKIHITKSAEPGLLAPFCVNITGTFAANSIYQKTLNSLLSSLSSNATQPNGFYNTTAGNNGGGETIYGIFLCRGDVTTDVCKTCVNTAVSDLTQKYCPGRKRAIIWYNECLVRYSNESFFGQMDNLEEFDLGNLQNITGNVTAFMQLLGDSLHALAVKAANDGSGKKFATREAKFDSFQTLYMLAQCTQDLSESDCSGCLTACIVVFPSCCSRRQGGRRIFPSCNMRYEIYPFYSITEATPPKNNETAGGGKKSSSGKVIVAIVVLAMAGMLVLVIALGICLQKTKTKKKYEAANINTTANEDFITVASLQYDLGTLQAATNNFSNDNKIGEGGFGVVYKGTLTGGQEIAVKRLSASSVQGVEQFKNEVVLVAKLQHRNLVKLLGFCLAGEENLLMYEFVPNKSLDYFLFDPGKTRTTTLVKALQNYTWNCSWNALSP